MNKNLIEDDEKYSERTRKIFRVTGIVGSIISGICVLLMAIAGDFSLGAVAIFLICLLLAISSKKNKGEK